jgi:hypothetical protein
MANIIGEQLTFCFDLPPLASWKQIGDSHYIAFMDLTGQNNAGSYGFMHWCVFKIVQSYSMWKLTYWYDGSNACKIDCHNYFTLEEAKASIKGHLAKKPAINYIRRII